MTAHFEKESTLVLIVADDLTGACDAGVHFAARGLRTQVAIDAENYTCCNAAVIACNTQTRCCDPEVVEEHLEPALAVAGARKPQILLKKIDSTLRGPVEQEIALMLKRLDLRMGVVAAAFPGAGRIVHDGWVKIHGSEFAVDIRACFPRMRCAKVRRVATAELKDRIAVEAGNGTQVLIVDADDDRDLKRIAQAQRGGAGILWAGSGGLAKAIAAEIGGEVNLEEMPVSRGPALVCVGSDHCVTAEQIRRLEQAMKIVRVRADEAGLQSARMALKDGVDVVLELSREQIESMPNAALGEKAGLQHCGGIIATGGDTAMYVLRSLGAKTLELRNEVEPGIPWSVVQGGEADGKVIVTKSGGFGRNESLLKCLEWVNPLAARRQGLEEK